MIFNYLIAGFTITFVWVLFRYLEGNYEGIKVYAALVGIIIMIIFWPFFVFMGFINLLNREL